jgi:hypothetical protein
MLAAEIMEFMAYVRQLHFSQKPDYAHLRGLLYSASAPRHLNFIAPHSRRSPCTELFEAKKFKEDFVFDWMEVSAPLRCRMCSRLAPAAG